MKTAGVILAGGQGRRFGDRKQFAELAGRSLLERAIAMLAGVVAELVVVVPEGALSEPRSALTVTSGGASRMASLANGIAALAEEPDVLVIGDCIRPFATADLVVALLDAVRDGADAAVPVWEPADVIKRRRPDGSLEHLGREGLIICQSPSACRFTVLAKALAATPEPVEESEAVERAGGRVVGVSGDRWSPHLIEQRDLAIAATLVDGGHFR